MTDEKAEGLKLKPLAHYRSMTKGTAKQPSQQQYKFVDAYLKTESLAKAYVIAGFGGNPHRQKTKSWLTMLGSRVRRSDAVNFLFDEMMDEWMSVRKMKVEFMLNEAMKVYESADTTRDKLDALRFVSELTGLVGKRRNRKKK